MVVGVAIVSLILLFSCLDDDDEVYLNISNCGSEVTDAAVIFSS